jgi:hypothetical protein
MKLSAFPKIIVIVSFVIIFTLINNVFVSLAEEPTQFVDSGQNLGSYSSMFVALSDLDGDGDLDAFIANNDEPNKVWLNNGSGVFSDSNQNLGNSKSFNVGLEDLDGDGDPDAFIANFAQPNKVLLNNGSGVFRDSGQSLGNSASTSVELGDLDGDGDFDALVVNEESLDRVWLNNGSGVFSESGQIWPFALSHSIDLGDLDGDGDLDVFIANLGQFVNRVWLNNGSGFFSDSNQSLGDSYSANVGLGDLDGDGDPDAFIANNDEPNKIWLNNGSGVFSDSGQSLGNSASTSVDLGDLDDDGDLDAFIINWHESNKIWLNNGSGVFRDSDLSLGSSGRGGGLGDLDGDGDLDAFITNYGSNKVWTNCFGPNILVLSLENKIFSMGNVSLNFTVDETTHWMGYSLDGQANVTFAANTTLPGLLDGLHFLVIYANNTAGNMGMSDPVYFTVDTTSPNVLTVSQRPLKNQVQPKDEVEVSINVTDDTSGVKQIILSYTNGNGTWISLNMSNLGGNTWSGTIPSFPSGTNIAYEINAEDRANNIITTTEESYQVIEDLNTLYAILGAVIATVFFVTFFLLRKRKMRRMMR